MLIHDSHGDCLNVFIYKLYNRMHKSFKHCLSKYDNVAIFFNMHGGKVISLLPLLARGKVINLCIVSMKIATLQNPLVYVTHDPHNSVGVSKKLSFLLFKSFRLVLE